VPCRNSAVLWEPWAGRRLGLQGLGEGPPRRADLSTAYCIDQVRRRARGGMGEEVCRTLYRPLSSWTGKSGEGPPLDSR
jgi:hypothetical protein